WGAGESLVISDVRGAPDAVNCIAASATPTPVVVIAGGGAGLPAAQSQPISAACTRFLAAGPAVSVSAYTSNPRQYAGRDVRLTGTVCQVQYDPSRDGKAFTFTGGDSGVPAFAPGAQAQGDAAISSPRILEIGVFVPTVAQA